MLTCSETLGVPGGGSEGQIFKVHKVLSRHGDLEGT